MKLLNEIGLRVAHGLPPEQAHAFTIAGLKTGLAGRGGSIDSRLSSVLPISGLRLPTVVGLAAGFDKNAEVYNQMLNLGFGFVECGTVTPRAQSGNPKPRLFRLKEDGGVINRMGFNNDGLDQFVKNLKHKDRQKGIVGANVGANKVSQGPNRIKDYVQGIDEVWEVCRYITLNISSPNTPGLRGLQNKDELIALLSAASRTIKRNEDDKGFSQPVFLKIAPDLDDDAIAEIVDCVINAYGLTGLIVSNTTLSRPSTLKSHHSSEAGGLSGMPLEALSTEVLRKVAIYADGKLDIVGAGGIHDAKSAYSKLKAGAHAVQLYSALVYAGSGLITEINEGLVSLLTQDGYATVSEVVGTDR